MNQLERQALLSIASDIIEQCNATTLAPDEFVGRFGEWTTLGELDTNSLFEAPGLGIGVVKHFPYNDEENVIMLKGSRTYSNLRATATSATSSDC